MEWNLVLRSLLLQPQRNFTHEPRVLAVSEPFGFGGDSGEDIAQRLSHPFPLQAYRAQMWAAALHDCYDRLDRIKVPTLVVHGREDRMIPAENGRRVADRIPNARLLELDRTGHLYPTEAPEVDGQIARFMIENST